MIANPRHLKLLGNQTGPMERHVRDRLWAASLGPIVPVSAALGDYAWLSMLGAFDLTKVAPPRPRSMILAEREDEVEVCRCSTLFA